MQPIALRPIGYVETAAKDDEIPRLRATLISSINVLPEWAPALAGLAEYSHLHVVFYMHRVPSGPAELTCHPRGNRDYPSVGVFASRGRNHPNPIGLAVVELLGVEPHRLRVRRLDAFHGTPVIDIKPYDHYDQVMHIREPEWLRQRRTAISADDAG